MKRLFTFLSAIAIAGAVNAQQTAAQPSVSNVVTTTPVEAKPAAPVDENLLILKETEHDFGKIPQGKPVTYVFDVANKGKSDLKISNVQASCGCTTPSWEKDKAVAPGSNTQITVGYNAAAEGPFTKLITITYNDGQTKIITIKGEVWKTPATSAPENKAASELKN